MLYNKVVKALNEREYKTKNGDDFIYTSARHILENPIYAGKIKYSGEIYQGNIEKKGLEGFYKVYPSLEPKERQALARLFKRSKNLQ